MNRPAGAIAAITLSLTLVACGSDTVTTNSQSTDPGQSPSLVDELEATGVGEFVGKILPDDMEQKGAWEDYFYDPAKERAICMGGTPYQVSLHRGSSNKLLIYLEGGGACWNSDTCWTSPIVKQTASSATTDGILNLDEPRNPFAGWNILFVSYCDGSVHAGNNIVEYDGKRTYHHGLQNLSAAVTLAQREFPSPERVVVSGSSAGGYGTFTGYSVTRIAYPSAPIVVFNDSGPGLEDPADTDVHEARAANWKYTEYFPESCADCAQQTAFLADWAMARDPQLRAALFNYLGDSVLRFFLSINASGFKTLLREVTDEIQRRHPDQFKRFLVAGVTHTVLGLPDFYTVASGDTTVRDWTQAFLDDSTAWTDIVEE